MNNTILELILIIAKQEKEIQRLQGKVDRITQYIETYEELIQGGIK